MQHCANSHYFHLVTSFIKGSLISLVLLVSHGSLVFPGLHMLDRAYRHIWTSLLQHAEEKRCLNVFSGSFQGYFSQLRFLHFLQNYDFLMLQLWFSMAWVLLCFNMKDGVEDAFLLASWRRTLANTYCKVYKYILNFGQIHLIIWTNTFYNLHKHTFDLHQYIW